MSAAIALSGTQAAIFYLGVLSGGGYLKALAHCALFGYKVGRSMMPPHLKALVYIPHVILSYIL